MTASFSDDGVRYRGHPVKVALWEESGFADGQEPGQGPGELTLSLKTPGGHRTGRFVKVSSILFLPLLRFQV